ncbi:MAG: hypothetical protein WCG06_06610, partial [Candidatus Omnitrophota bacterium]
MNGLIRANWLSVLSHEIAHVYHRETQEVPDFVTFFKKLHDLSGDENNFVSPYARTHATEDFAEVASQIVEDFDVLLTKGLERFQNREPLFLEKMLYVMSHMFVEERNGKMVLLKSRREFMPLPTTTDYTDMRYVLDGILPAEKDNSGRITRLDYNGFSYRFTYDGDGRLVDIQKQSRSAMDNLDTNQDGVLTAAEAYPVLRAIVSAVGKQRGDVSWAEASKYDLDNNGVITSSEAMRHLNAFNAAATVQEQRRFVALENLDANKDGAVTAAEAYPVLRAVQNALAKKVGDAGWAEVAKYDLDKNLVITPTELATFINAFNAIASPGDQKLLKDLQTLEANKSTAAANFASWFDQGQLMIGSALSAQGSRYTGEPKALVDVINGILGAEYTIASPASGADQPVLQLVKYPSMILLAGTTNLYLDLQNNVVYEGSVKSAGFAKDNSSQSIQFKALVQKMFDTANGH